MDERLCEGEVSRGGGGVIEAQKAIHPRFLITGTAGRKRLVWKISTDMKKVLVPSEGHLDAATGFVVFRLLQEQAKRMVLEEEIEEYV